MTTSLPSAEAKGTDEPMEDDLSLVISHAHARTIATYWLDQHNPDAPLTVLAGTGAIGEETVDVLESDLRALELATTDETESPVMAQTQLTALLDYVQHYGVRGAVTGWPDLPHEDAWSRETIQLSVAEPAHADSGAGQGMPVGEMLSLYERLGGGLGVGEIVETFYRTVLADPALAPYFDGIDVHRVKAHQYAFITAAAEGPDYYAGRSLQRAHSGLGITSEHFDRILDHLVASLDGRAIDQEEIGLIVGKVARYRDEIVGAE